MPATLKTFSFRLVLAGVTEIDDAMKAAILGAGCDDAGLGSCEGVVTLDFDREAESLADAIASAIRDVERAGYAFARIDIGASKG